jgi:hypothetical protein
VITDVPLELPLTTPVLLTVATPVLPLVHVPPVAASLSVVEPPSHKVSVPLIDTGVSFTVIVVVALPQPLENVIADVPCDTPVYTPLVLTIVATPVLPLVHDPTDTESDNVAVPPTHTTIVPVITDGNAPTVTVTVAEPQPFA